MKGNAIGSIFYGVGFSTPGVLAQAFTGNDGTTIVLDAPDLTRDAIMRFIVERKEVAPKADGSWSLAVPQNVTMTFTTGPNAAAYQPAGIKVEKMGDAPEGFVKYRIVG